MHPKHQSRLDGHLGRINVAKQCIEHPSPDTALVQSASYQAGPKTKEFETAGVEKLLVEYVIKSTQIEWACPILSVAKKGGKLQLFLDYRKLNAVTKRDSFLISGIDYCISSLGEAAMSSTLDANNA